MADWVDLEASQSVRSSPGVTAKTLAAVLNGSMSVCSCPLKQSVWHAEALTAGTALTALSEETALTVSTVLRGETALVEETETCLRMEILAESRLAMMGVRVVTLWGTRLAGLVCETLRYRMKNGTWCWAVGVCRKVCVLLILA